MAYLYSVEGHIGLLEIRNNLRGEKIIESIVVGQDDPDHNPPLLLHVACGLFDYLLELEGDDMEERYLRKRFWYDDTLTVMAIEVLNRNGETCKAIFDTTVRGMWRRSIWGSILPLNVDNPPALDADSQNCIRDNFRRLRHGDLIIG